MFSLFFNYLSSLILLFTFLGIIDDDLLFINGPYLLIGLLDMLDKLKLFWKLIKSSDSYNKLVQFLFIFFIRDIITKEPYIFI
jgi:hypothetical protein